jgi:phosphopantothenoylcysteine decarboxylase/phosphopantothenate--cysteine ligase
MNVRMWQHPATQDNLALLQARGLTTVGPNEGAMACNEHGFGRMAEPAEILAAIEAHFAATRTAGSESRRPLAGRRALVTSGPTREPLDPVRYLSNHSSGKQGHAVAAALAALGAETTLVRGPVALADPPGVRVVRVETAEEMLAACRAALPVEIAVCAAAVADWRVAGVAGQKLKKDSGSPPRLELAENPDILATLSRPGPERPRLVVGFAAETERVVEQAIAKRARKGCDWILANDVSAAAGTFGGDRNSIHLIDGAIGATGAAVETWPRMTKAEVARRLARRIADSLDATPGAGSA